jgi:AraC-like DNA-binding protein
MAYAESLLCPALHSIAACAWAIAGPAAEHRVLPDGCIDILVSGEGGARVVGTMRAAILAPRQERAAIGIRFRPGEAARLLPAAPRELTDADAPLSAFWGEDAHPLEDALVRLIDVATREGLDAPAILRGARAIFEEALRRRLTAHGGAHDLRVRAAAELLQTGATVRDVAAHVGLSERQLTRRFGDRVGVGPKIFGRVMRLQRAVALLAEGNPPSMVAAAAGYADQAHFTRDSVELAGVTPRGLAREVSDSFKTDGAVAA